MTSRLTTALIVVLGLAPLGPGAAAQDVPEPLQSFVPVTDEMLLQPKPENWISFRNGYSLWGYSELDQIDAGNVGELRLVWSRAMQEGYQEVEPLVYDGIMFLPNVEDIVPRWTPHRATCCGIPRNVPTTPWNVTGTRAAKALYDDKIFVATNDAYLVPSTRARRGGMGDAAGDTASGGQTRGPTS